MTVDLAQFHGAFFEESREALDGMEAALLGLDVGAPSAEAINTIFRAAHSIKGGSGMFNFTAVTSFTHSLETLLDAVRSGQKQLSAATIDMLLKSVDVLREMLGSLQAGTALNEQRAADVQFDIEMEIANGSAPAPAAAPPALATAAAPVGASIAPAATPPAFATVAAPVAASTAPGAAEAVPPTAAPATPAAPSSVTASSAVAVAPPTAAPAESSPQHPAPSTPAAATLVAASSAAAPTESSPPHAPPPPNHVEAAPAPARPSAATGSAAPSPDASSIRVSIDKLNELMNTVGELVIVQSMLSEQGTTIEGSQAQSMRANLAVLERNMRSLQECVMRVRMLPINTVFSRFPRMVRDLAQRLNKQIELKIVGEQTELDKTVLEMIGDPLTHLVRNCVDHGIELASQRIAKGKPAQGTVRMEALHRGGNIVVEVSDDGAGLNKDRILAKAQGRGLVPMDAQLTEEEIHELIFAPGLSTQEQATDLSGRGVGMDVVRRNIQELGGSVKIGSTFGQGSKFTITLPLTLAIMDGQSVCVGRETYILPLVSMVQSMQLRPGEVKSVAAQMEVFQFRGEYVPIVRLHERFAVEPRSNELCRGIIVIVEGEGRRIGLFVDELLGQQQVVIKSLRDNYRDVHGISGATILGNGAVALILDVPGLVRGIAAPRAA